MNRILRILTAIIVCNIFAIFIVLGISNPVEARRSIFYRKQNIQRSKNQVLTRLKAIKARKGEVASEIKKLDQNTDKYRQELLTVEHKHDLELNKLRKLESELSSLQNNLVNCKNKLKNRIVQNYVEGEATWFDLLFSNKTFSDMVDHLFLVQVLTKNDQQISKNLELSIEQIDIKRKEVEKNRLELQAKASMVLDKKHELVSQINLKQDVMKTICRDQAQLERQLKELIAESNRIEAELRAISRNSARSYRGAPWTSSFHRPVGGRITSGFGMRVHPILHSRRMHTGIDIGAPTGTSIRAAGNGMVVSTGWRGGYGNCIIVDHGNGRATLYAHCSSIVARSGQVVKSGQTIGRVGSTGFSTGPHLHWEVRINGRPVNPLSN